MKDRKIILAFAALIAALGLASSASAQTADLPNGPTIPAGEAADDKVEPVTSATPVDPTAPPETGPQTPEEMRERLIFLLSGYEFFPSRDDLDKVGGADEIVSILVDIVRDADGTAMHRLRAVDALGFYDEPAAAQFLRKLVKGAKAAGVEASARHSVLMQHHAITAIARSQRDEAVADLEPFLVGSDLQLKLSAVVALGKHGKDDGRERLRALIESDDNKHVQREARKYLR